MKMSHLRTIGFTWGAGALLVGETARGSVGSEVAGGLIGSLFVEAVLLVIVLACFLTAFKIYVSVRGGKIALGWRWFAGGFGLFGIAQLVWLGNQTGILVSSDFWVGLLRVGALLLLFIGATRMRKLLT